MNARIDFQSPIFQHHIVFLCRLVSCVLCQQLWKIWKYLLKGLVGGQVCLSLQTFLSEGLDSWLLVKHFLSHLPAVYLMNIVELSNTSLVRFTTTQPYDLRGTCLASSNMVNKWLTCLAWCFRLGPWLCTSCVNVHVLLMHVWIFSGNPGWLSHSKIMHVSFVDYS